MHYLPVATRGSVLARDGGVCIYCRGTATGVDHVMPIWRGGTDHPDNLVACCRLCNGWATGLLFADLGEKVAYMQALLARRARRGQKPTEADRHHMEDARRRKDVLLTCLRTHEMALWLYADACRRVGDPPIERKSLLYPWGYAWKSLPQEMKDLFYLRAAFALWGRSPRVLLLKRAGAMLLEQDTES